MLKKYKVEMPEEFTKLKYGFSIHDKNYSLIVESTSMIDINIKYPNAISIKKL